MPAPPFGNKRRRSRPYCCKHDEDSNRDAGYRSGAQAAAAVGSCGFAGQRRLMRNERYRHARRLCPDGRVPHPYVHREAVTPGLANFSCAVYDSRTWALDPEGPASFQTADSLYIVTTQAEKRFVQVSWLQGSLSGTGLI